MCELGTGGGRAWHVIDCFTPALSSIARALKQRLINEPALACSSFILARAKVVFSFSMLLLVMSVSLD